MNEYGRKRRRLVLAAGMVAACAPQGMYRFQNIIQGRKS